MTSSNPSCCRLNRLHLRKDKPCILIFRQLLVFLVIGHMISQNGVVFCADKAEPEMSCYSCDQSGSEAGDENEDDLCINPNPASDENPSITLACPESDNKCASIRLVHHYGEKVAVVNVGENLETSQGDRKHNDEDQDDAKDQDTKNYKEVERKYQNNKMGKEDEIKHQQDKNSQEDKKNDRKDDKKDDVDDKKDDEDNDKNEDDRPKKEVELKSGKEERKDEDDEDEDERRKRSSVPTRRKRSTIDTSFVEIARKGCSTEKRVRAALDCFRNLFHHPYQRYLGKCTVTQFGREAFLMIKQKCEPGTLPKDMRVDMDRQDKFYLLLCTCEGDLCNDKELLELDKRVFIPEIKMVGNGTPWDEGWGRMGSGGGKEEEDDDEAMRKKFKNGGTMRKVGWLLILAAVGMVVARGKF